MRCPRCQTESPTEAKFCLDCGSPLARSCASCGTQLTPTAKFCPECGHPATSASPARPRLDSPESYTPKHLAEKILLSKSALEGERKQVTVLFADLKGSMELLADRDPEDARELLDPVLERMMDAVHRYEGTVNQVMGDGIMALFGAPVAHEDHGVRACYAALDMQAAIRRYAGEMSHAHGVMPQIRIGLNSGEVVVRAIGNDLRIDYTAVGQTTHLAARMEQLATPGTVLLTADTLRLVEGYVNVKPRGAMAVKGLETALDVYEVTGLGPLRSRLHAAALRGLTRFVGREGELEQLRQALNHAAGGHGQVVAIVGEPGVGKSRLVWEVTHSDLVHSWRVLQAGSVSYGKATSYLPVVDLLRRYFALEERDSPRAIREKVTEKLSMPDGAQDNSLPALLSLLDVPIDDPQWPTLDPPQRRRRILDAVKRLLLRESQKQPLLVVFEDLHWIDSETQALLDALVDSLPAARLALLVNYRPEYQHSWGSRTYYCQIRLDPLPAETAEHLLGVLLGSDPGLEPLKQVLIARTEGNPFFLEESVRSLAETEALRGQRGEYELARPLPAIQVPATVQAVLAARIDRLPPGDKALLQTASVIGKDVPLALLREVAEVREDELPAAIGRLQAAEFLYEAGLSSDHEYTFKHALTHEVTYGSLLHGRRRFLDGQIVSTIERRSADRLVEQVVRLAHHAFRGELWDKAVPYLRQAGAKAAGRSAHRDAVLYLERALTALGHLPETRETQEQAIDIRFELRHSLFPLAEFARIEQYLREAEAVAQKLDDQRRLGWVSAYMSGHYMGTGGRLTEMLAFAERAGAIGESLNDVPLQIAAQFYTSYVGYISGDYQGSDQGYRRLVQWLHGDRIRERFGLLHFPAVTCRSNLARTLAERGLFDEGTAHGQDAIAIAQMLDHPYSLVIACRGLAYVDTVKGDLGQASRLLERAIALCRDWDITAFTAMAMASLGQVRVLSGRAGDGLGWLQQALATHRLERFQALSVVQLGETYLLGGQLSDARMCADRALMLARQRGERGSEAWALRLLGDVASQQQRDEAAVAAGHYGPALALASELGMRPLVAHCHLGLGKLYHRVDDVAKAKEHLTTALTMYRTMNMPFWAGRTEAEM